MPTARQMARKLFPDAVLVRLGAAGVRPNGKADLTLDDSFDVTYRFISPSGAKRPPDLPIGVSFKPNCLVSETESCEVKSARWVSRISR